MNKVCLHCLESINLESGEFTELGNNQYFHTKCYELIKQKSNYKIDLDQLTGLFKKGDANNFVKVVKEASSNITVADVLNQATEHYSNSQIPDKESLVQIIQQLGPLTEKIQNNLSQDTSYIYSNEFVKGITEKFNKILISSIISTNQPQVNNQINNLTNFTGNFLIEIMNKLSKKEEEK